MNDILKIVIQGSVEWRWSFYLFRAHSKNLQNFIKDIIWCRLSFRIAKRSIVVISNAKVDVYCYHTEIVFISLTVKNITHTHLENQSPMMYHLNLVLTWWCIPSHFHLCCYLDHHSLLVSASKIFFITIS